ncbi:MAG: hypothetical protein Q9207_006700 [Kuettlingeria erythrocarpa]
MWRFGRVCASGDLATVSELFDTGPRHSYPEYLNEGLYRAIFENHVQVAEFLLDNGAVIDRAAPGAAAHTRSLPVFKLLVKHGWDINTPIMRDITPLMYVSGGRTAKVIPSLIIIPQPSYARHHYSYKSHSRAVIDNEELVKWLLDQGVKLPAPDLRRSRHILNTAAASSSVAVFDLMIEHGATRENSIPLHTTAGSGRGGDRIPMMTHLIDIGYDINGTDDGKWPCWNGTPLHYALKAQSLEKVEFLLQKGADPYRLYKGCGTPFSVAESLARSMGRGEFISLLKRYVQLD